MRNFILLAMVVFGVRAHADFTVLDPQGELKRFARDLQMGTFEDEMVCRQTATYLSETTHTKYNCNPQYCMSQSADEQHPFPKFTMNIEDCSASGAFLYSDRGLIVEFKKDQWTPEAGYFVQPLLEKLGEFVSPEGTITIKSVWNRQIEVLENGRPRSRMAPLLEYDLSFGAGLMITSGWLLIDRDAKGLKRIMALGTGSWGAHPDIYFKIRGLLPAAPAGEFPGGFPGGMPGGFPAGFPLNFPGGTFR